MATATTPLAVGPFSPPDAGLACRRQLRRAHRTVLREALRTPGRARARREAKAKALCAECPVVLQCREAAHGRAEYGLWGGESEEDRFVAGVSVGDPAGLRRRLALRAG